MKRKLFISTVLLGCFIICFAAFADMTGTWKGSIKLPDGTDYPVTYIFNVKGDSLSGSGQAEGEPKPIINGKMMGSEFTFNITNDDGTDLPHSGKYFADGDSVAINVDYQGTKLHASLKRATK